MLGKCVAGASVLSICEFGDGLLIEETIKVFKKDKEMKKGNTKIRLTSLRFSYECSASSSLIASLNI